MLAFVRQYAHLTENVKRRWNKTFPPKERHVPRVAFDPKMYWGRKYLSWRHIRGSGLEIGALHQPLPLFFGATAKYVDRMPLTELRAHYPELIEFSLKEPDIIDDGETLATVPDESVDFIVANHFIEHCEDPILTISTHLRKLRNGGILFLAVPNKHNTFDRERPVTTLEHLCADHEQGPQISRAQHYEEWVRCVTKPNPEDFDEVVTRLIREQYSIHFHVWDGPSFREFLQHLWQERNFPCQIVADAEWEFNPFESLFLLRKCSR